MEGFKQCNKGHFYKDTLNDCPYCPKDGTSSTGAKTELIGGTDTQRTSAAVESQKTQVFGGEVSSDLSTSKKAPSGSSEPKFDATKTIIGGGSSKVDDSNNNSQKVNRRKLRGWLVSFDIEEFGMDFRVIEGRNTLGQSSSNDITIIDEQISGMHALILCKKDKFILSDELSSNGTLLNGKDLTPREPNTLNDGDEIRIGTTNLLFKTAFKS